jgi:hypothetical protein
MCACDFNYTCDDPIAALLSRLAQVERNARQLRKDLYRQRRRAEMWRHRATSTTRGSAAPKRVTLVERLYGV